MNAPALDVAALLPHQPPMRLLERVVSHAPRSVLAEARLTRGGPFDVGGEGDGCASLELVAQAAALVAALRHDGAPLQGRVASCRELTLHGALPLETPLQVHAEHTAGELGFASFRGEVRHLERLLAEVQLTVVLAPDDATSHSSKDSP